MDGNLQALTILEGAKPGPATPSTENDGVQQKPAARSRGVTKLLATEGPAGDLFRAIDAADLETVRQMVDSVPTFANLNIDRWRPLEFAAMSGQREIVALLLDRGAATSWLEDPDAADRPCRHHVLHSAVRAGHSEVLALLLERSTDLNVADYNAALGSAAYSKDSRYANIFELLLRAGADPEHRNYDGRTASTRMRSGQCIRCGSVNPQRRGRECQTL
jgi:hypothetical protein